MLKKAMNETQHSLSAQKHPVISEHESLSWMRLCRTDNVGPITFYQLISRFGSAKDALDALPELAKKGGRKKPLTPPSIARIEAEYEALQKMGGNIITAQDTQYPLALSSIDDAPPVLSYFGDIKLANKNCIGVVGSRNASISGRKFAQTLASDLGERDQIIVSGLARGIDTAAHHGALKSGTIAVVAGGIDVIYPKENTKLFHAIAENSGLVLAESALGQAPQARLFPKRNRIVSGLSAAVVVVEANMRSGSLITARLAGEQGRAIMAVPGHPMDPRAAGSNHLIREGATLIRDASDAMEEILNFGGNSLREPLYEGFQHHDFAHDKSGDIPENAPQIVLENLSFTPVTVDEIVRNCHLSVGSVQSLLLEMELAGRIIRLPGNRIQLSGD